MATAQSSGLCPLGQECCGYGGGEGDPTPACCEPSLCEECAIDICVDNGVNKPNGTACGYDCECASDFCDGAPSGLCDTM